jgi:aldehyde dehydrogenase (NAD+)
MTGFARARLMHRLADRIDADAERLATLEVNDSGKLFREMIGQLRGLGGWYRYFAGLADKLEGRQIPAPNPDYLVYTRREPVGVVGAITPWNSPLLLMTWKLAPALAAGCTVVVKPSEHSPTSTLGFASLVTEAGFPPGVVNVVTGLSRETGAALAAHPGWTRSRSPARPRPAGGGQGGGRQPHQGHAGAGRQVAAGGVPGRRPGRGRQRDRGRGVRRHRADLHGRLPADRARRRARRAGPAGRRPGARIRLGDPTDPETEMGPVANRPQYEKVVGYLDTPGRGGDGRVRRGATEDGLFVRPTVLTGVDAGLDGLPRGGVRAGAGRGPVPDRGRGGQARQRHPVRAGRRGVDQGRAPGPPGRRRIRAGTVWVNAYRVVAPNVPFGGFGSSGIGRENGLHAVDEYLAEKAVWVELTGGTRDPFVLG